jgi:outer membrane immunogenic protein
MKKKLLITAGVLALGTGLASAADLPARMPVKAPPVVATVYDWTGFYFGGNAGGKWGRFDDTVRTPTGAALGITSDSDASFVGGGQVGYMWQTGQFVFGVEGDIDGTRLRNNFTAVAPVVAPFVAGDVFSLQNDWQASARGRLGWAADRVLLYVTGGAAWGNLKATGTTIASTVPGALPAGTLSLDRTLFGWTVGGGVDFGIAPNWSIGAEYRFTRFNNDNNGNALGTLGGTILTLDQRLDTHEVTARLNYHFNMGGAPGRAAY